MGGRIAGVAVLAIAEGRVFIQELHSTKGWRHPIVVSERRFAWLPVVGTFSPATRAPRLLGPLNTGRLHLNRGLAQVRRVNLMAHGWYRRQMIAEAANADLS